jgi:hypothetical protein
MSPILITRDGQMVTRLAGNATVGTGKRVRLGYSTVETAGSLVHDDEVSERFLERVKNGEVAGARWFENDERARQEPLGATPEAQQPQNDQPLKPGGDTGDGGSGEAGEAGEGVQYQDDPDYDPEDHIQADVLEYLKTASPDEVARVQKLEASGKGRDGIASYTAPASFEE